jgi:hypothetical protein
MNAELWLWQIMPSQRIWLVSRNCIIRDEYQYQEHILVILHCPFAHDKACSQEAKTGRSAARVLVCWTAANLYLLLGLVSAGSGYRLVP